ncbi:MAG TPA: glycosyltransferase family 39 protein [Flavisolibacter sp.]|nr:glycosyltransferase family 39 protein [Flavisolibacter sp.]
MQMPKKVFLALLLLEVFVNFSGIAVPFFSNDPALYAAISKTMVQRNDFVDLYVYGIDWLDKPHFPFWMAAFSFKIFGVSEWAYRLPALLFILIGAFYTYRLAKKLYNVDVAQIAVLVLLAAQHLLMSSTDVRAEPYLLTLIVGAVYHFYNLLQRFSFLDLILGALLAGCGVMTKGVFALVPIGTSIVGQAIFANQFRQLFRWRWLLAVVFTAIFILPEVYAVYVQFDKHPEKIVFGSETGVSGVKWFLWDSQFSRFVNNGPITRPKGDLFYYVHTLFWAYAPWCLLFYFVFAKRIIAIVKKKKIEEYVTVSAIVPMLLFFSLSKFQLNFYTNILFPFFSILVASFIGSALAKGEKTFYSITQAFYSAVFIIGIMIINFLLKPQYQWAFVFGSVGLILSAIIVWQKANSINLKWLIISCLAVLYINFYLNFTLYPKMSSLKGENQAAAFVNEFYPNDRLGVFQNRRNGFEFYTHQPVQQIHIDEWISGKDKDRIFYVDDIDYPKLSSRNAHFKILKQFVDYNSENIVKYMRSTDSTQTPHRGYLIRSQ